MTGPIRSPVYAPTPGCAEFEQPFEFLAETFGELPDFLAGKDHRHVMVLRQQLYRGKVEDFALVQLLYLGEVKHEIARVDCCNGTIHKHLYSRDGQVLVDHGLIQTIPPRPDGVRVVDSASGPMWERMLDEWSDNLRRWDRGR